MGHLSLAGSVDRRALEPESIDGPGGADRIIGHGRDSKHSGGRTAESVTRSRLVWGTQSDSPHPPSWIRKVAVPQRWSSDEQTELQWPGATSHPWSVS